MTTTVPRPHRPLRRRGKYRRRRVRSHRLTWAYALRVLVTGNPERPFRCPQCGGFSTCRITCPNIKCPDCGHIKCALDCPRFTAATP